MREFEKRLEELEALAHDKIDEMLLKSKDFSKHSNESALIIKGNALLYNLEGGRYLTEIVKGNLVDSSGYRYDYSVLDIDKFMEVVDHFVEIYK